MLDAEKRATLRKLQAQIDAIKAPGKKLRKESSRAHRKATRAARDAAPMDGQRDPRREDPNYLSWIRGLKCVGCVQDQTPSRSMRSEAAHVRFADARAGWSHTGKGTKPHDRRTLPLCVGHHRQGPKSQHAAGERAWWEARDIYAPELCAALEAAYATGADGNEVIRSFVAKASQTRPADASEGGEAVRTIPNSTALAGERRGK